MVEDIVNSFRIIRGAACRGEVFLRRGLTVGLSDVSQSGDSLLRTDAFSLVVGISLLVIACHFNDVIEPRSCQYIVICL